MTRKLAALVALVAIVALAAAPASAAPSSTGAGLVAGTGWRIAPEDSATPGDPRVEFKVAAKFAPGSASGTLQHANVDGSLLIGEITCGSVDAGVAVIGGRFIGGNTGIGHSFFVFFVDNGAPTFGSLGPDAVSFLSVLDIGEIIGGEFPSDFPDHCPPARGDTFAAQPLMTVLGNIVIH